MAARGREATRPTDIPALGWRDVLARVKVEARQDNVALLAGGAAFYLLLGLVPGLIAVVSIYGLVADPADVGRHVDDLLRAAPPDVRDLVREQLESVTTGSRSAAGIGAVVGVALAIWSASSGMKHLMTAVNVAYDEVDRRGFVRVRLLSLLFTVCGVAVAAVAVVILGVVPSMLEDSAVGGATRVVFAVLRWPILGLVGIVGLAVLYRFAPDRDNARWTWVSVGSLAATGLWLLASLAFSLYVSWFGSYEESYGSLGGIVVAMLWLLITTAVVILGAELNAELERQTRRDTTEGPPRPLGARGAYAADTVGPTAEEVEAGREQLQRAR